MGRWWVAEAGIGRSHRLRMLRSSFFPLNLSFCKWGKWSVKVHMEAEAGFQPRPSNFPAHPSTVSTHALHLLRLYFSETKPQFLRLGEDLRGHAGKFSSQQRNPFYSILGRWLLPLSSGGGYLCIVGNNPTAWVQREDSFMWISYFKAIMLCFSPFIK